MKNKLLFLSIGFFVGLVISTGAFFVYSSSIKDNNKENFQMTNWTLPDNSDGERREMPSGERPQMPNGERPELPNQNSNITSS